MQIGTYGYHTHHTYFELYYVAACDTKYQFFNRRSVILERCLKECTAGPKK